LGVVDRRSLRDFTRTPNHPTQEPTIYAPRTGEHASSAGGVAGARKIPQASPVHHPKKQGKGKKFLKIRWLIS